MNKIKFKYQNRKICLKKTCKAVNSVNSVKCVKKNCKSDLRLRRLTKA